MEALPWMKTFIAPWSFKAVPLALCAVLVPCAARPLGYVR